MEGGADEEREAISLIKGFPCLKGQNPNTIPLERNFPHCNADLPFGILLQIRKAGSE